MTIRLVTLLLVILTAWVVLVELGWRWVGDE